jgi:hypothetical protein
MITEQEMNAIYAGKCPDCGGPITEGPHGGAAVNMLCYSCGSRFNILDPDCGFRVTGMCDRLDKLSASEIEQYRKLYP